ncbi:hypothetical protein D3C80_1262950 [compost metagenome]
MADVPGGADEGHHTDHHDRAHTQRHDDAAHGLEGGGAADPSGLFQLAVDLQQLAADELHAQGDRGQANGEHQAEGGAVQPVHAAAEDQPEDCQGTEYAGNTERDPGGELQQRAAEEARADDAIGHKQADDCGEERGAAGDQQGVEHRIEEDPLPHHAAPVRQRPHLLQLEEAETAHQAAGHQKRQRHNGQQQGEGADQQPQRPAPAT